MKRLLSAVAGLLVTTSLHAQAPEVSLWVTLGDADQVVEIVLYTIPVSAGARPLEPSADGKAIYVALSKLLGFVVVDPIARKVVSNMQFARGGGPKRIAIGRRVR